MAFADDLQMRVSQKLGFGPVLIRDWTPSQLALFFDVKHEIQGQPDISGGEILNKLADKYGVPATVIDTDLLFEVVQRKNQFKKEGIEIPWGEHTKQLRETLEQLNAMARR